MCIYLINCRFETFNLVKKTKSCYSTCIFIIFVDAEEIQVLISKHILKTLCTDVTNILFNFLAGDMMMSVENPNTISSEVRNNFTLKSDCLKHLYFYSFVFLPQVRVKILSKLPEDTRGPLMKLHNCLNGRVSLQLLTSSAGLWK